MKDLKEMKRILEKQYLNCAEDYEEEISYIMRDNELSYLAIINLFYYGFICGKRAERARRKPKNA